MLQNISVANFLAEKLNSEGQSKDMAFKIFADAGAYEGASAIHGVLSVVDGNGSPIEDFMSVKYVYALNFEVVDHNAGERIKIFNEILSSVIRNMQGHSYFLDGGEAIFTFGIPLTSDVKVKGGFGLSIASSLSITVAYSTTAVTTSNKVWLLDGFNVPYLDENIDLEIEGSTNNIYGLNSAQSLPIKQTRFYRFTLPFSNANPLCAVLQKDMLSGDMTKVYTLSYYDGISYTKENPFITKVSLFRTGNSGASKPSVSNFSVVFTDVDDDSKGGVRYEMALIDNPFDSGSANVRYFSDRLSQQNWYANKIAQGAPYSTIKAPNLESLTITQQIYIKPPSCNIELNNLLTKNYAVIRATDKKTNNVLYYYYYYVQSASVGANNQIMVGLNLDTIQTYYFDPNIKIADCLIERAHLNRWIDNKDGTVSFNNAPDSPLMNTENTDLPKKLISRQAVYFGIDTGKSKLNDYMQNIKQNWLLIFFQPNTIIGNMPTIHFGEFDTLGQGEGYDTGLCVCCCPLNGKWEIELNDNQTHIWGPRAILYLLRENKTLLPHVVSIKISSVCPLAVSEHTRDFNISGNGAIQTVSITNYRNFNLKGSFDGLDLGALMFLERQSNTPVFYDFEIPCDINFTKNEIIGSSKNSKYNPKMLSQTCRELNIVDFAGNSFTYDIQKINSKKLRLLCNEILTPDITKGYLRIADNKDSCYNNGCEINYTGLMSSNDTTLPYVISKYSEFISQNKNFALIQQSQRDYNSQQTNLTNTASVVKGFTGIIGSLASGNIGNALTSGANTATDLVTNTLRTNQQNDFSKLNESFTIDNMRSAPGSVKNAQGNILANFTINGNNLGSFIDIYGFLLQDGEKFNDFINSYGFSFERAGNIKNYENIRKFYNYIQAQIESISGISISNDARNDIRRRFASGIRFWNSDDVQYNKENYENWLAN